MIAKEKMIRQIINSGVHHWFIYDPVDMIDNDGTQYIYYNYDNVEAFAFVDNKDGVPIIKSIPISYDDMGWFKDLYNELNIK